MKRLVCLLPILLLRCDCTGVAPKLPGDENLGTYGLQATGTFKDCTLPDISPSYSFQATFSRSRDGGPVFITLNGLSFDAGFDGQVATWSQTSAPDIYQADGGTCACAMKTQDTLRVALLSASQSRALDGGCPDAPLDGGLPAVNPDAGITAPGALPDGGFDAVRACGELSKLISGTGFCDSACYSCKVTYRITGERQ